MFNLPKYKKESEDLGDMLEDVMENAERLCKERKKDKFFLA